MGIYRSFAELPDTFDQCVAAASQRSPFLSRIWFDNYITTVVHDPARVRLVAMAPQCDRELGVILPLYAPQPSHPLATRHVESLANFYTPVFEPLSALNLETCSESIEQVVGELVAMEWDVVNLRPLMANGTALHLLRDALERHGCATQQYYHNHNWRMTLAEADDFGTYLAGRSNKIRKTLANRVRKFDRDQSNRFEIITRPEQVQSALVAYDNVYGTRWGRNEPFDGFIPGLVHSAATAGWLRLGIAWVGNEPAAVQLWLVSGRDAYIFKVAFDIRFKSLSIGSVATFKMMEHVISSDGVRRVDFLTGNDAYKQDWMTDVCELHGLIAFKKRTFRGLAAAVRHFGGHRLRRLVKRVETL